MNIKNKEIPKQYIIINKKLNMSPGKLAAQVSLASIGTFLKFADNNRTQYNISFNYPKDSTLELWLNSNLFTKIILYVKSEEKLISIFENKK